MVRDLARHRLDGGLVEAPQRLGDHQVFVPARRRLQLAVDDVADPPVAEVVAVGAVFAKEAAAPHLVERSSQLPFVER